MSESDLIPGTPTKLTVNLTGDAFDSLTSIAARLGLSRTEAVNIALNTYAALAEDAIDGWETYQEREGTMRRRWWGNRSVTVRRRIFLSHLDLSNCVEASDRG